MTCLPIRMRGVKVRGMCERVAQPRALRASNINPPISLSLCLKPSQPPSVRVRVRRHTCQARVHLHSPTDRNKNHTAALMHPPACIPGAWLLLLPLPPLLLLWLPLLLPLPAQAMLPGIGLGDC